MRNALRATGIVSATVAACLVGAFVGTVGVIAWASYDTFRKMKP